MKKLVLTLAILIHSAITLAAGRETGGAYVDFHTKPVLEVLANELAQRVSSLHPDLFQRPNRNWNLPADWSPQRVATVIKNLQFDTTGIPRSRHGRQLMLDFDQQQEKIIVLAPFLLAYNESFLTAAENYRIDTSLIAPRRKLSIWKALVHEVSHLWGFDDAQSNDFAERIVAYTIQNNTLHCSMESVNSQGQRIPYRFVYSFADARAALTPGAVRIGDSDASAATYHDAITQVDSNGRVSANGRPSAIDLQNIGLTREEGRITLTFRGATLTLSTTPTEHDDEVHIGILTADTQPTGEARPLFGVRFPNQSVECEAYSEFY